MPSRKLPLIEPGFQVFVDDAAAPVGAVRQLVDGAPPELLVHVEGAGEFQLPLAVVARVHDGKVVLERSKLPAVVATAIAHATDGEDYPPPDEEVETVGPVDDRINEARAFARPGDVPNVERNPHVT